MCVEVKAWADVRATASALGATHTVGSVEGALLEKVYGLKARPGDRPWDVRTGTGWVKEKRGDYHDALYNKRNTVVLFMVSLFGGLSAQALRYMTTLRTRAKTRRRDTTDHVLGGPPRWMAHWTQRLSAAVVMGDAERALARADDLRQQAATAAARARAPATAARPTAQG